MSTSSDDDEFGRYVSRKRSQSSRQQDTPSIFTPPSANKSCYEKPKKLNNSQTTVPALRRSRRVEETGASKRNYEEGSELFDFSLDESKSLSFVGVPDDDDDNDAYDNEDEDDDDEEEEEEEDYTDEDNPKEGNGMSQSLSGRRSTRVIGTGSVEDKDGRPEPAGLPLGDSESQSFGSILTEDDDEVVEVTENQPVNPNNSMSSGTDTFRTPPPRRSIRLRETGTSFVEDKGRRHKSMSMSLPGTESSSPETGTDDEFMWFKLELAGDGTNNSLELLTEFDIKDIKENREVRQNIDPADIFVQSNPERYFLAEKRIKRKKVSAAASTPAGAKKVKKPRKGNRTGRTRGDNLPEKSTSNFSVSAEIAKLNLLDSESPISTGQSKHEEEIEAVQKDISKDFPHWLYVLRENFNILLYGYGSKEPILENFKSFLNDDFMVVEVNGLFPKLNPRKFLLGFWDALGLDYRLPAHGKNILGMAEDICTILKDKDHPSIFFIIHNLERLAYKLPKLFEALCCLARIKFIHLVATVDHINTGIGIGHSSMIDLNLFWINCTTFASYEEELSWKQSAFAGGRVEETTGSSLDHVLKSLTANARKAFRILVSLQLNAMTGTGQSKAKNFEGIKFLDLLRKCREAFVAHGEMPLRTLLTEFVDHKLIRYAGKGKKTDNLLIVDLEIAKLEQIVKGQ